ARLGRQAGVKPKTSAAGGMLPTEGEHARRESGYNSRKTITSAELPGPSGKTPPAGGGRPPHWSGPGAGGEGFRSRPHSAVQAEDPAGTVATASPSVAPVGRRRRQRDQDDDADEESRPTKRRVYIRPNRPQGQDPVPPADASRATEQARRKARERALYHKD